MASEAATAVGGGVVLALLGSRRRASHPGPTGGQQLAVVGSEAATRVSHTIRFAGALGGSAVAGAGQLAAAGAGLALSLSAGAAGGLVRLAAGMSAELAAIGVGVTAQVGTATAGLVVDGVLAVGDGMVSAVRRAVPGA